MRTALFFLLASLMTFHVYARADAADAADDGKTVWLLTGQRPAAPVQTGLLVWELYRQAFLIAARDGMGLRTRDESLREWRQPPPASRTIFPSLNADELELTLPGAAPGDFVWRGTIGKAPWPDDCAGEETTAEKLSRKGFVAALRAHGWSGTPDDWKPDAAEPAEAEGLLNQMDELSQFAVLRMTDSAIRTDGESPPRLAAIVRAYANLGQLAQFQWSIESKVYTARALLYAQRLVVREPKSAFALWHRAYARAMAGLMQAAMDDVTRAQKIGGEAPPAWSALLEPYCKFDTANLSKLATANSALAPLGTFLAYLTVEQSGCQGAVMNAGTAALHANPNCLRLIDSMCWFTGPGMLNELNKSGQEKFSQMLGAHLEEMPGMPKSIIDMIHQVRRPNGNPPGREIVCQALIDNGLPERDAGEPSLTALARMIQEITFAQTRREADLIAHWIGEDANGFVEDSRGLVADHPYEGVIKAYGLWHDKNWPAIRGLLKDEPLDGFTTGMIPLIDLDAAA